MTDKGVHARVGGSPLEGPVAWGGRAFRVAACVAVAVALGTLATLPEYGVTSDEPVIYHGGERQWWAMWSGHPDRWDFKKPPPADFQATAPFNLHPDPRDVYRFPGFPELFCAVVARLARFVPGYDRVDEDQRYIRAAAEVVREETRDGGLIYGVYRRRRS